MRSILFVDLLCLGALSFGCNECLDGTEGDDVVSQVGCTAVDVVSVPVIIAVYLPIAVANGTQLNDNAPTDLASAGDGGAAKVGATGELDPWLDPDAGDASPLDAPRHAR